MSPLGEGQVVQLLSERYSAPEWVFLAGVRSRTGFAGPVRTIDGLAISTYPSRGHEVIGFEVKSARSDWRRELADPDKAEEIAQHCDRWFVVAGGPDVVPVDEVPVGWGLLVADDRGGTVKLRQVRAAAARKVESKLPRAFVASILRSVADATVPKSAVDARVEALIRDAVERERQSRAGQQSFELEQAKRDHAAIKARLDAFEAASGVKIDVYRNGDVGTAFAAFQRLGDVSGLALGLASAAESAAKAARVLSDEAAKLGTKAKGPTWG